MSVTQRSNSKHVSKDIDVEANDGSSTTQPEHKIATVSDHPPFQGLHWILALSLDSLVVVTLFWNNYQMQPWSILVVHYYSWILFPNLLVLWVDPIKRHFWLPFRVMGTFQILIFLLNMLHRDMIHLSDPIAIIRLALLSMYLIHAIYLSRRHGPTGKETLDLVSELIHSENKATGWLVMSFLTLFCSNFVFNTHFDYGMSGLEGPLTAFQATISLTGNIKALVLDHCIQDLKTKCQLQAILALLFIVQWAMFPNLFMKSPFPFFHLVAEFAVISDSLRFYVSRGIKNGDEDVAGSERVLLKTKSVLQ